MKEKGRVKGQSRGESTHTKRYLNLKAGNRNFTQRPIGVSEACIYTIAPSFQKALLISHA